MPHIFTYGTLMFPEVWGSIVRGHYSSTNATIHHYKRSRIRVGHYPVVLYRPRAPALTGVIYFNVTQMDLDRLDRFEGNYYERKATRALSASGRFVKAQLYVLKPQYRHLATQQPWSPDEFQRRHQQQFIARYAAKTVSP